MTQESPSIISHVSVGTNDFERSAAFYDAVLATIGARRVFEPEGVPAIAYGKAFPEFWIGMPIDHQQATAGNGAHFAFLAPSREAVQAFWDAALANGASPDGEPGERPHYGPAYYGCFVRDPDGNKIEAMFWDMAMSPDPTEGHA